VTTETRAKISKTLRARYKKTKKETGYAFPARQRRKIALANIGRKHTPETKAQISAKLKASWTSERRAAWAEHTRKQMRRMWKQLKRAARRVADVATSR
jgi:NUMOD3 motif